MSDAVMEAPVEIEITRSETDATKQTSSIGYRVRNVGQRPVWVVSDPWFVWRLDAGTVTISFARAPMREGVEVFGYFDPEVVRLAAGASVDQVVAINWPLELNTIWNRERHVWPDPGRYQLRIEIGFGFSSGPEAENGTEAENSVLDWQYKAVSQPGELMVPAR